MRKFDPRYVNLNRRKIGGKWKPIIMLVLYQKDERFNKLKQLIEGISGNMLTQCLRELDQDKIIYKNGDRYGLTEGGRKITELIIQIKILVESL